MGLRRLRSCAQWTCRLRGPDDVGIALATDVPVRSVLAVAALLVSPFRRDGSLLGSGSGFVSTLTLFVAALLRHL